MQHDLAFEKLVAEVRPFIKELSVSEVKQKFANQENFVFIDVREDHEWTASLIPGAIHIGRGVLERDIATQIPDKNTEIVLYCGGGFRSALAAYNLKKMGYTNIASMDGGICDWKKHGYPIEN